MEKKIIKDKQIWEKFIDKTSPYALFQRWDWGDVQEKAGVFVYRFGFYEGTTLFATVQATIVQAKRGNFLHIRHGPVVRQWEQKRIHVILRELFDVAKKHGCVMVRISPLIQESPEIKALFRSLGGIPAAIHAMDGECSWVLDINKSDEELLSQMRKTTRYEIRKAQKLGVIVEKTADSKKLSIFNKLYSETSKRHKFIEHHNIKEEFEIYAGKGNALLFTGHFDGKQLASAVILFSGGQAIYHHGASIPSSIPASYLIQWEAIQEAKKRGMKRYNFWGIAPKNATRHPWAGLSGFKMGFGGEEQNTIHAYDFPVSSRYWLLRMVEFIRKLRKGY